MYVGEDTPKDKSSASISKKKFKLSWFFKFLLIAGAVFSTVLLIGIIWVNISTNRNESLKLQKEIIQLKNESNKQLNAPTSPQPTIQQPATPTPPISNIESKTIKIYIENQKKYYMCEREKASEITSKVAKYENIIERIDEINDKLNDWRDDGFSYELNADELLDERDDLIDEKHVLYEEWTTLVRGYCTTSN